MALEEGYSEGNTSSSAASNNQVPLAIPGRGFDCPICLDIIEDETSVSWCRHTFCFPCILEWACIRPVCPICQEPFQYLFRKVGDSNYEVYYTRSPRCNRGRRSHRHSAERRRYHSAGHRQHSSSRRQHGSGHARDWERDRSRSQRQNHDGHSRSQQAQSYDHSRSRRWQHSSAQETDPETSRGWDQASRHERDVPVRSGRSEHRHRAQWVPSRELWATRSRSWRRSHGTWHQTQREEQRRRDYDEGQSARPEWDVPDSLGRSEHRQQAQQASSREAQATRSRSHRSRQTYCSPEGHTYSNNQVLQAERPHNSENLMCPICLDVINNQVSVSWCRHTFCFPCILEWSCNRAVCPVCREPSRYLLRKVGDNNYEVYSIGHYISSARLNRGRRDRRHSAERRWHHSTGHGQHRSSSRERGSGCARDWERDRSRSQRQNHDGHSRSQQARSYDHSRSRRWQHSSAQETDPETSRGWDQASRYEQDVPVRSGRSEHRHRAQWVPSRESWAARSQSHRSQQTSHRPEGNRHR